MQIDIEDNLTESSMVGFQAALLYTNTKGGFFVVVVHATNLQTYKNMKNSIFFMLSFKILPYREKKQLVLASDVYKQKFYLRLREKKISFYCSQVNEEYVSIHSRCLSHQN